MDWVKKFRILTFTLIFSGALNIGLIAALLAFAIQDKPVLSSFGMNKSQPEQKISNVAILHEMAKLSFRELVTLLTNRELIEEGYAKRDLALSALVSYHHFHLEKALGDGIQKRKIQDEPIELFPGLSEEQFEAVIRYAYQEKWPLNSKGLFSLIQKVQGPKDPSLLQAFSLTPEVYALSVLFQKSGAPQELSKIVSMATEGTWEVLDQFAKEQTQLLDLSVEKRRRVLLSFLAHRSKTAAQLLVKTDSAFAMKRLDEKGVIDLLSLLPEKTPEADAFCASLLNSSRSDAVLKAASDKARSWGATVASAATLNLPEEVESSQSLYHTVGQGESLWKISRSYKVTVDEIANLNGIDKDKVYPGMTLKIPQ